MEDEDDDIYAPSETITPLEVTSAPHNDQNGTTKPAVAPDDGQDANLEEDDEEEEEVEVEEDDDSDIDIITEHKDGSMPEPPPAAARLVHGRGPPGRPASETPTKSQTPQIPSTSRAEHGEHAAKSTPTKSGADYPAIKTSKIDVDAKPMYEPTGKLITEVDLDTDFGENDKPWRRPGSDPSDYFNYGFDEFTWANYCLKQTNIRKEVVDTKKQMEEMQAFLSMPGMTPMPGMQAMSSGAQGNMPPMSGIPDPTNIPPDMMQQMMAQIANSGMDPSQMDPTMFMQQVQQMTQMAQSGSQTPVPPTGPSRGFNTPGPNQGPQMGYGYDNMGRDGARMQQGNFAARGRGGVRRNW